MLKLATLVAQLCFNSYATPGPSYCLEEIVTQMPYTACKVQGQIAIAQWMASTKYREDWRLTGWKCEDGQYVVKGRV